LKSKIVEFVTQGDFGLASGKKTDGAYERTWFKEMLASDEVAFEAGVFLLRKATAEALSAGRPATPAPTPQPEPGPTPAPTPEPRPTPSPGPTASRWFWAISIYVDPKLGIVTSGRAASLDEAKAQFLTNWQKCRTDSTPPARSST
jgi:hypothetical protein